MPPCTMLLKALFRNEQFYVYVALCTTPIPPESNASPNLYIHDVLWSRRLPRSLGCRLALSEASVSCVSQPRSLLLLLYAVSRHNFLICITPGMHPPAPTTRSVRKPFSKLQCTVRGAQAMLMARLLLMASTSACSSAVAAL